MQRFLGGYATLHATQELGEFPVILLPLIERELVVNDRIAPDFSGHCASKFVCQGRGRYLFKHGLAIDLR